MSLNDNYAGSDDVGSAGVLSLQTKSLAHMWTGNSRRYVRAGFSHFIDSVTPCKKKNEGIRPLFGKIKAIRWCKVAEKENLEVRCNQQITN